jgi:RHS repeat-associated protein
VGTEYGYSPYGEAAASGASSGNEFQYTGREDDGTGLYYFRARYYDPRLSRFIAQDPIGLNGGINVYAYAWGNPRRFRDPLGLRPLTTCEKDTLSKYFLEEDLNRVDLHESFPWWLFWVSKRFDAITLKDDICFREGVYNSASADGLALLGHEMVHVDQYASGMTYLKYLTAGGYDDNPYETVAYLIGDMIREELRAAGAACPPPSKPSKSSGGFG